MKVNENFISKLKLKFHNKELENEYIETGDQTRRIINIIYSAFFLVLCIIATILFSISTFDNLKDLYYYKQLFAIL
jgi:hypothetical protein